MDQQQDQYAHAKALIGDAIWTARSEEQPVPRLREDMPSESPKIPAYAGMTKNGAGMTKNGAEMTKSGADALGLKNECHRMGVPPRQGAETR